VNTTSKLTTSVKSSNGLLVGVVDSRVGSDLETTHGVVKNRSLRISLRSNFTMETAYHKGNVEVVVHLPFRVMEELHNQSVSPKYDGKTHLLLERVRSWVLGIVVVVVD
jgi:hypothetical protein